MAGSGRIGENRKFKCQMREEKTNIEYTTPEFAYDTEVSKPTLLLHSCCGPCSTSVIEDLIPSYAITIFFYNPNITDRAEYEKRLLSQKKFIEEYNSKSNRHGNIALIEGVYEPDFFLREVKGLEGEPEGGARCRKCFRMRLEKTAEATSMGGYSAFATTLSVSPHKNFRLISETGRDICARYGIGFIDRDFKKADGYLRSVELAKQYGLYRQSYCGCEFSKVEK